MNIYQSINAIMEEIPAIAKDSKNKQQGFMYRGIEAVLNTMQPILARHKVFTVPTVLEHTREDRTSKSGGTLIYTILKVKYTFYAEDGSFIEATVNGEGMDSGDKSNNKAMAVAMKYAMFQVFSIPTETDPDGESHEIAEKEAPQKTQKQAPKKDEPTEDPLQAKINYVQANGLVQELPEERIEKLKIAYKVKELEDLTLEQYQKICNKIKKEREEKGE